MGKSIKLPTVEEVTEYYINSNRTIEEASAHFNISTSSFSRFLRANGLAKSAEQKSQTLSLKTREQQPPTKEELEEFYITQNHSQKETASQFGTSLTNLRRWLQKYGIIKPKEKRRERFVIGQSYKRRDYTASVEECVEYFITQCHTIQECCEHFNTTEKGFCRFLRENNINKTPKQTAQTIARTSLEKYGEAFGFAKTPERREKIEQTCLEKYGVTNPSLLEEVKQKIKDKIRKEIPYDELYSYYIEQNHTIYETASHFNVSNDIINARCGEYGIKKDDSLRVENISKQCRKKYGVDYYLQSAECRQKAAQTNLAKYGVACLDQKNINHLDIWNDAEKFKQFLLDKPEGKYTACELKNYFNVSHSTALDKIHALGYEAYVTINPSRSQYEDELVKILKEMGINNIILNDRKLLDGKEIDIYLPDYKIGIEFDGEYYHSEANSKYSDHNGRSTKHQDKSLLAESKGIFLFHIFEHEWDETFIKKNPKFKEIKQNIINRLKMLTTSNYEKIPARKCILKEISYEEKKEFLDINHIQGNDKSSNKFIGLFYNDELVSCMTFGSSKYKKYNYELSRFCTKIGYIVQGGASKLFKYFVDNVLQQDECVVSYNDITKTNGKIYSLLGFEDKGVNCPNYWWVNLDTYDVRSRYQEQKAGEVDRMHEAGYYRICDCGTRTWVYTKN